MRLLQLLAFGLLLSLGLSLHPEPTAADPPVQEAGRITDLPRLDANYALTYKVEASDDGVRWGHGTGAVIWRDGHLLTQSHVVAGASVIRIRVRNADGTSKALIATVVADDPAVDLAVIKVDHRFAGEVEFEDPSDIKVGDLVYSIGHPYQAGKSVDRGWIKQMDLQPDPEDPDHPVNARLLLDIPDGHGTSGSCIFSMKTGRAIATMKAYAPFGEGRSPVFVRITVPVTTIYAFLNSHDLPYRSPLRPTDELRMRNLQR